MGTLTVERVDATLGAVVRGISLADLDDATFAAVLAAFHEHAVLAFPGQHLEPPAQKAFGQRFGSLEDIAGTKGLTPITNKGGDGSLLQPSHPVMSILKGNEGWHTDSSYEPVSAKASMLSAHVVPPSGSTTEWADMRAAYDDLDPDLRAKVEGLAAHHSIVWSQARLGLPAGGAGGYGVHDGPGQLRPMVKVHPATGRKALFVGRHAHAIPGLDEDEGQALIDHLNEWACQPPRVYVHRWEVGDLVLWDNRCVLHRARPWDLSEERVMLHTRVTGDPATESALASV